MVVVLFVAALAVFEPFDEFGDVEVAWLHVGHRVDDATKHVVHASVFAGAFDAHHVLRLFDHADHAVVAAWVGAYRAWAGFAHVAADIAEPYFFLDFRDGVDQCLRFLIGRVEQVEGDALRAFRPDAGQVGERVDESLDGAVIGQSHGSYLSLTGCRSHVPDN